MERRERTQSRETLFIEPDEAIFSLALTDEFPDITFTAHHPDVLGGNHPCGSIALSDSDIVYVHIGPITANRYLHILRSRWGWGWPWIAPERWSWDPPTLGHGVISTSHVIGDEEARLFGVRVWRILGKIATNKLKGGTPETNAYYGGDRKLMSESKGGMYWAGHQALAWCRAGGERRMLDGLIRPCDDWEVPQNAWYQDLVRRAMATEAWYARTLGPRDAEIPP
jgi:hypothetical protein